MGLDVQPRPQLPFAELLDLTGKKIVVTGGARGIGLAVCRRLTQAGASLVIGDLNGEGAAAACAELAGEGRVAPRPFQVDVSDEAQARDLIAFAQRELGGIDILVTVAGIYPLTPIRQIELEEWERVMAVNLRGVFLCVKQAAEAMIEQGSGGKILSITSLAATKTTMVGQAHYEASKHGLWGFLKNAALEYAPHGITVNAVAPGSVFTPGAAAEAANSPEAQAWIEHHFGTRVPLRRWADPDEMAKVMLFLASDMASYMTGSEVIVDGGWSVT